MIDNKDYFLMLADKFGIERRAAKNVIFQSIMDLDTYLIKYVYSKNAHELVVHTRRKKFSKKIAVELIAERHDIPKSKIKVQSITKLEAWTFYNG